MIETISELIMKTTLVILSIIASIGFYRLCSIFMDSFCQLIDEIYRRRISIVIGIIVGLITLLCWW